MAFRIKQIWQNTAPVDAASPADHLDPALIVTWADDDDNEGLVRLEFATYTSIEAEWNGGQGTTFTAIDAALDTELATVALPDSGYSSGINTGKDNYNFAG